ncbi:MAG: preprotein translocase subunit SecA, partial [Enterococcus sp.]|nr:preprotein translocase subunit SecA [Enterococcus sp.]
MSFIEKIIGTYSERELKRIYPIQKKVLALDEQFQKMSDAELKAMTPKLKERLANGETLDDILPEAFATCREASLRVLGMKHFPVQIIGGIVLHQGRIAEMRTGEGKTLVATLPAYLNGLSGDGVHVVTVNDYLATRDSEWMGKLYRFLGLSCGLVVHGLSPEERREQYACDITYGTNNEFGFDYLRDNMQIYKENKVQRGFNHAIVDEVDSILIDEARTPLIISGAGESSSEMYTICDNFAKNLKMVKVKELDDKKNAEEEVEVDGDYVVDEKAKTATLTENGIAKAERYFDIENLMDLKNSTLLHHINQAIKARGTMQRDINYVVADGEVMIVDEFTGRIMEGRRYSDGLHQAIEAKEGVEIKRESRTLATVTYQNYFRMYKKLSGMTGTAETEQDEFREIYGMDVVVIPTNKPIKRHDHHDVVYKTEKAKFNAAIEQVIECHKKGQPVLVGTVSIEKSEVLSDMLKKRGVKHEVLNAKYHEKEAQIVAQAGKLGSVTIATNMAGRGTDIVLGGNAEYLAKSEMRRMGFSEELISEATGFAETEDEEIINARKTFAELIDKHKKDIEAESEKVKEAGGLFIVGTERHESRRIDNQLRGRSGRQGDVGETKFFLSLEDDLMRLFGGDRITNLMDTLNIDEDMPIENRMLTKTIESAQCKLEGRNFGIRKNVLRYDDVMNKQREIIYSQRDSVLNGDNLKGYISQMIEDTVKNTINTYLPESHDKKDWNVMGLREYYLCQMLGDDYIPTENEKIDRKAVSEEMLKRTLAHYEKREQEFGEEFQRELERVILLQVVDKKWIDHIDAMDELKKGISLRSYGQKDPVVEYRIEGFDMFDYMIEDIREETIRLVLTAQIKRNEEEPKREQVAKPIEESSDGSMKNQPIRTGEKVGRNDPCP